MSRKSYGGDMFSPLRCDFSVNEVLKSSESDCSLNQSKVSCDADNGDDTKNEGFQEFDSKNNSGKGDTRRVIKIRNDLLQDSPSVFLPSEKLQKNRNSYITTRNKKTLQNDEDVADVFVTLDENKKSRRSKSDKNDKLTQHVTLRPESANKLRISKTRQRESFSSSLASLAEEKFEKEPVLESTDSTKINSDFKSVTSNEILKVPTSSTTDIKRDKSKTAIKSNTEASAKSLKNPKISAGKNKKITSTVECKVQTDLLMSDLSSLRRKEVKCNTCKQIDVASCVSNAQSHNQVQQIQASIIEKLVKDTVSFEFEEIRQLLYYNQLSLLKRMDKNLEASSGNTILLKVIEELVEENRRLKRLLSLSQGQ